MQDITSQHHVVEGQFGDDATADKTTVKMSVARDGVKHIAPARAGLTERVALLSYCKLLISKA